MAAQQKTVTLEQFLAFCERSENRDKLFELIDGEIVEKVTGFLHSTTAVNVGYFFKLHLTSNNVGYVTGADGTYLIAPDFAPMPDVAYISRARLPEPPAREVQGAPDIAVEIKSPTDSKRDLRRKAERYLTHGTRLVWLVFPEEQEVEVYVPDKDVMTFKAGSTLDGADVLPGFTLAVSDVFG